MQKVPVQRAALLARLNRRLAKDGRRVYRSRSVAMRKAVGDWAIFDDHAIVRKGVDLEVLARELDVLAEWETLE